MARREIDPVGSQFLFYLRISEANRCFRRVLIITADFPRLLETKLAHPSFHQPKWMSAFPRQFCGAVRVSVLFLLDRTTGSRRRQFAQHGIGEWHRRSLA